MRRTALVAGSAGSGFRTYGTRSALVIHGNEEWLGRAAIALRHGSFVEFFRLLRSAHATQEPSAQAKVGTGLNVMPFVAAVALHEVSVATDTAMVAPKVAVECACP